MVSIIAWTIIGLAVLLLVGFIIAFARRTLPLLGELSSISDMLVREVKPVTEKVSVLQTDIAKKMDIVNGVQPHLTEFKEHTQTFKSYVIQPKKKKKRK